MRSLLLLVCFGLLRSLAWSSSVAPIAVPASTSTVFNITKDDDLWFFNGQSPANYKTQIHLQAAGPSQGTFRWEVTTNKPAVALETGGSLATKTNDPVLNVESKEISLDVDDVTVNFQYNGQNVGDFPLTVSAPLQHLTELVEIFHRIGDPDKIPPGFSTFASYRIVDQFGSSLPRPLVVNEFFETSSIVNLQSNNWAPIGANFGFTQQHPSFPDDPNPSYFQDHYSRTGVLSPLPETPAPPTFSTEEVFRINQKYFTGSATSGVGRQTSFSTLRWYRAPSRLLWKIEKRNLWLKKKDNHASLQLATRRLRSHEVYQGRTRSYNSRGVAVFDGRSQ